MDFDCDYESAANRRRMGPRQFAICHGVYQVFVIVDLAHFCDLFAAVFSD